LTLGVEKVKEIAMGCCDQ